MNELHLFAGAGGGILGGMLLGHVPVCAVELEEYPRSVLLQRQRDGILPWFPVWDDVRTFDGRPWRGRVDVVCGGFPCQDISAAGRGAGIDGERSGLWSEFARIIGEVGPEFVFVENSPVLVSRGLGRVLGDLAEMGFDAEWGVLGADDTGAPHIRKRIWILADSHRGLHQSGPIHRPGICGKAPCQGTDDLPGGPSEESEVLAYTAGDGRIERRAGLCQDGPLGNRDQFGNGGGNVPDTDSDEHQGESHAGSRQGPSEGVQELWDDRPAQPGMGGVADGMAPRLDGPWADEPADLPRVDSGIKNRVGRLKALGNGQVPVCAALAFQTLYSRLIKN